MFAGVRLVAVLLCGAVAKAADDGIAAALPKDTIGMPHVVAKAADGGIAAALPKDAIPIMPSADTDDTEEATKDTEEKGALRGSTALFATQKDWQLPRSNVYTDEEAALGANNSVALQGKHTTSRHLTSGRTRTTRRASGRNPSGDRPNDQDEHDLAFEATKEFGLILMGMIPHAGPFMVGAVNLIIGYVEAAAPDPMTLYFERMYEALSQEIADENRMERIQAAVSDGRAHFQSLTVVMEDYQEVRDSGNPLTLSRTDYLRRFFVSVANTWLYMDIFEQVPGRVNNANNREIAYYLLPYSVPFALLHIGFLRERYLYGPLLYGSSYDQDYDTEWLEEIDSVAQAYDNFFETIHTQWSSWYPQQIPHPTVGNEVRCQCGGQSRYPMIRWTKGITDPYFDRFTEYSQSLQTDGTERITCQPRGNPHSGFAGYMCNHNNGITQALAQRAAANYGEYRIEVLENGRMEMENLLAPVGGLREYAVVRTSGTSSYAVSLPMAWQRPTSFPEEGTSTDLARPPVQMRTTCGGGNVGNGHCSWGCCSQWGWCGTTANHCGETRTCGSDGSNPLRWERRGNGVCQNRFACCSWNGYCGMSHDHCNQDGSVVRYVITTDSNQFNNCPPGYEPIYDSNDCGRAAEAVGIPANKRTDQFINYRRSWNTVPFGCFQGRPGGTERVHVNTRTTTSSPNIQGGDKQLCKYSW